MLSWNSTKFIYPFQKGLASPFTLNYIEGGTGTRGNQVAKAIVFVNDKKKKSLDVYLTIFYLETPFYAKEGFACYTL